MRCENISLLRYPAEETRQGRRVESDALAAAPGGKAQDPDAGCFGGSLLLVVKGQQSVGSDFNGDGDME